LVFERTKERDSENLSIKFGAFKVLGAAAV
jgi:hypothetical protein